MSAPTFCTGGSAIGLSAHRHLAAGQHDEWKKVSSKWNQSLVTSLLWIVAN
jgi:hypothetical protein